jgi:hypothetical protein
MTRLVPALAGVLVLAGAPVVLSRGLETASPGGDLAAIVETGGLLAGQFGTVGILIVFIAAAVAALKLVNEA